MSKLARGYRAKNGGYNVNELNTLGIGLNSHTLLIIRLPDSRALRIISRSLFFAMILLALPSLGSIIGAFSDAPLYEADANGFKVPPVLLHDLVDEGLIKKGHKGFVPSETDDEFEFLRDAGVDLLTEADLQQKKVNDHNLLFDFVFATSFKGIKLIDTVLKDGGLVIYPLGHDSSDEELRFLRNFKIIYLRRFDDTIVAMRKSKASPNGNRTANEVSCGGVTPEKKIAALKGLEDVYLEPPREAKKSSFTSRKIKLLPDLLDDSLDEYPRRVFISDDSRAVDWFYKNYPMRDQEFDVYGLEYVKDGSLQRVSSWVVENVRRDDYVVMKAEAGLVEDMLKDKSLCFVDELFMECKNQWEDGEEENGSKRAYWQCLELYGKVRDEGIAVHQWWY